MSELISALQALGAGPKAIAALAAFMLFAGILSKSGIVKKLFAGKRTDREILSEDQNNFLDRVENELREAREQANEDRKRAREDREECEKRIGLLLRDAARWRHFAAGIAQYVIALQSRLAQAGITAPPFAAWDRFIEEGGDPDDHVIRTIVDNGRDG